MSAFSLAWEKPFGWRKRFTINLDGLLGDSRKHDIPVIVSFAVPDMDQLAVRIDIFQLESNRLPDSKGGRIDHHEQGAVFRVDHDLEEPQDFLSA